MIKKKLLFILSFVFIAFLPSCELEPLPSDEGETSCWQFSRAGSDVVITERLTELEKDAKIQELDDKAGGVPVYYAEEVTDAACE